MNRRYEIDFLDEDGHPITADEAEAAVGRVLCEVEKLCYHHFTSEGLLKLYDWLYASRRTSQSKAEPPREPPKGKSAAKPGSRQPKWRRQRRVAEAERAIIDLAVARAHIGSVDGEFLTLVQTLRVAKRAAMVEWIADIHGEARPERRQDKRRQLSGRRVASRRCSRGVPCLLSQRRTDIPRRECDR